MKNAKEILSINFIFFMSLRYVIIFAKLKKQFFLLTFH